MHFRDAPAVRPSSQYTDAHSARILLIPDASCKKLHFAPSTPCADFLVHPPDDFYQYGAADVDFDLPLHFWSFSAKATSLISGTSQEIVAINCSSTYFGPHVRRLLPCMTACLRAVKYCLGFAAISGMLVFQCIALLVLIISAIVQPGVAKCFTLLRQLQHPSIARTQACVHCVVLVISADTAPFMSGMRRKFPAVWARRRLAFGPSYRDAVAHSVCRPSNAADHERSLALCTVLDVAHIELVCDQ
jgi:hypothetical protein